MVRPHCTCAQQFTQAARNCSCNLFSQLKHMTFHHKGKIQNQTQLLRSETLRNYFLCVLSELSLIQLVSTPTRGTNTCRCVFILYISKIKLSIMKHIFLLCDVNFPYRSISTRFQKQTHWISSVKNVIKCIISIYLQRDLVMLSGLLDLFLNIKLWV